jgi:hypothetical protein
MSNLIREGTVPAVARGYAFGEAKTGTEQIGVQFELLGGPDTGRMITWYGYFTEKTYERTLQSLRYMGWKGTDVTNPGELDQKVMLVIAHEEDQNGDMRARVQWVNGYGSAAIRLSKPMTPDKLRTFSARMAKRAAKVPELEGERAPDEVPPPSSNDSDWSDDQPPPPGPDDFGGSDFNDDIPF